MDRQHTLAEQFETHRGRLEAVAYRMLGSLNEAEDAVQECWMRLSRSDMDGIDNMGGWLTTVVSRVCLDMLRSRKSRREDPIDTRLSETNADPDVAGDPEREALMADAVGLALLVVLDTLTPSERIAFVLHDIFALPFEEIAPIVGRSHAAARQLASRARRRVQGGNELRRDADLARRRELVEAFLAASRAGNFEALLKALDPDVELREDRNSDAVGAMKITRGAHAVASQVVGRAVAARPALVDGAVGIVVAPFGRLMFVLKLEFANGVISGIERVSDPVRLEQLELADLGR